MTDKTEPTGRGPWALFCMGLEDVRLDRTGSAGQGRAGGQLAAGEIRTVGRAQRTPPYRFSSHPSYNGSF
jgi:hypothetical protein